MATSSHPSNDTTTSTPQGTAALTDTYADISTMTPHELEVALHATHAAAKKLAWSSPTATPDTMVAILAMYAMQEIHALGFQAPSAIRAMVIKMCAEEYRGTKGCLLQARKEVGLKVRERKGKITARENQESDIKKGVEEADWKMQPNDEEKGALIDL